MRTKAMGVFLFFGFVASLFFAAEAKAVNPQIDASGTHTVALMADGTVKTWGYNLSGQLGDGTTTNRPTPVTVSGLTGVSAIAAGIHTVALMADGTVKSWGPNSNGQLGDGTTTARLTPVAVTGLTGVMAIAAGSNHTVALMSDGTVKAWGSNSSGQLGDGTNTNSPTPVTVTGLTGVMAIAAGSNHTVALMSDGTVKAWGDNSSRQLGDGTTTSRLTPVAVTGLTGVVAVAAGNNHTVALMSDGTVKAWGLNSSGQLGDGTTTSRLTPVAVTGLTGVMAIAAGGTHTVALMSDGTVNVWGSNGSGQLGDGTRTNRLTPVSVTGLTGVTAITAADHTVALMSDGTVKAWGDNPYGQLGDGTTSSRLTPVAVPELTGVVAVAAGGTHTVALMSDGTVKTWGSNSIGQLGDGTITDRYMPVTVTGLTGVTAIAAGYYHTVALMSDGTVKAWGYNGNGTLGDGTTTNRLTPVAVTGLTGVTAIAVGHSHTVALMADGTVKTWGSNSYGQLGDGTNNNYRTVPVTVTGLTGVTAIAACSTSSMALLSDGTVKAWGRNEAGQLGDGTTTDRLTPVSVTDLTGATAIAVGTSHSMALLSDGTIKAWGNNYFMQLGDGTSTNRLTPVTVTVLGGAVTNLSPSYGYTVVLMADGTVKAWGLNSNGQLGNGTTSDRSTPGTVTGLTGVTAIATKMSYHAVAVLPGGTVKAWGNGSSGQLGVNPGWLPVYAQINVYGDDFDADGVNYASDNCPTIANPAQANFDGDALGDACDDDDDNDGIADAIEIYNGTDPFNPDTTPPAVTLTSSVTGLSNALSTLLTYGTSEGTVALTRNGTPVAVASGGSLALVEGRNTIVARAVDAAGNVGTAQIEVNVDTLIFPPTIDALPTVWSQSSFTATGRMEDGAAVVITPPAGTTAGAVTYPTSNAWSCTLSGLVSGSNIISVTSTDAMGNISAPVSATLTVDLGLPSQVTGLVATNTYQGGTVLANWSSYTGPAASYNLYVSSTPFTDVTGMTPWRSYPSGTTSATLIGLTDNVAVYVAVVAIGAGGQSIAAVTPVSVTPTRQGLYGTVRDYVRDFPLNHMQVQVAGYPPVVTDTLGRYVLTGLPAGSYSVTIGEIGGDVRYTTRTYNGVVVIAGTMTLKNLYIFSTSHNLDCGTPGNLTATPGDGKVTLCWDALTAADLAGYIVYRDGVALQTTTAPWLDTCFTDTNVVNGTTYSYVVTSYSRGNILSSPTNTVQTTPQAATQPPVDLTATLGCDGKVTLNWLRPAGTDQLGYNVYQAAGTAVDYGSTPAYVTGADTTTWTSGTLTGGNYAFAVRSVGSAYEEANTHVVVTISVPANWNQPSAAITIPSTGKRVDGNALHVQAEAVAPTCGTVATSSIRFQYRPNGTTNWLDIPAALAQYPNPDTTSPFFIKWDVTGLPEGAYDLRAEASSSTTTDLTPGFITVTIDHHQPEFSQNRAADNSKKTASESEKGRISTTQTGEAQVTFAPNSLMADTTLLVKTPTSEQLPAGSSTLTVAPIDLTLTNGQSTFTAGNEVTVGLTYQDANNDGVIDGTGIFAQDMEAVTFNTGTGQWEPLPGASIDTAKKQIKGQTSHFSMFGAKPKANLSAATAPPRVYQPTTNTNGTYQISWNHATHSGRIYEVQQATDAAFTQNLTTIYSGPNNYVNVTGTANGNIYYRVRTAAPGRSPSSWQGTGSPVTVTLTCDNVAGIYAPASSTTGSFQVSWNRSRTPNVTYELQVDDGRGFQYLTATTDNYVNLAGIPNGSYAYRVKASKGGFVDSGWKQGTAVSVNLTVDTPGGIYAPATNTSGSYQVSWNRSRIPGAIYVLTENGSPIYSGPNNYVNLTGRAGGAYSYRVKATRAGYNDSAEKGPVTTTVGLQVDTPANIYAPASNSSGSYQVSWNHSRISGAIYKLYENGGTTPVYTGTSNYFNVTGKLNGTYSYAVVATKAGYADSSSRGPVSTTVNLTVDTPAGIYAPASNTTGNYQVSWNHSRTQGVTYLLEEQYNGGGWTEIATPTVNYVNFTAKTNGTYAYRVTATKPGYVESATKQTTTFTVAKP